MGRVREFGAVSSSHWAGPRRCWVSADARAGDRLCLKVIALDYQELSSGCVFATAALVLALAVAYWLAVVKNSSVESHGEL